MDVKERSMLEFSRRYRQAQNNRPMTATTAISRRTVNRTRGNRMSRPPSVRTGKGSIPVRTLHWAI